MHAPDQIHHGSRQRYDIRPSLLIQKLPPPERIAYDRAMDFGKVSSTNGIDFSLPPDPPANASVFNRRPPQTTKPNVLLGLPVWTHPGYVGKIFPVGTKSHDYLYHYSRQFPTIELNSTFYGYRTTVLEKWRDTAPEGFLFCPKLPKEITHDLRLVATERATQQFVKTMEIFGDKLGVAWMLLPESFGPERRDTLLSYVRAWPRSIPLAVELRDRRWFENQTALEELFAAFEETATTPIITDAAGRRDVLHQRLTNSTVVLRFLGNLLHPSDFTRLDTWVERLHEWITNGVTTVYIFLHQPEEDHTIELAEHLADRLRTVCGIETQSPQRVQRLTQQQFF